MSANGWEQLDCKYFPEVCRKVLDGYLSDLGFSEKCQTRGGGLLYTKFDTFLELDYDTNLFPKYVITVVVGFGEGAYSQSGGFSGVPMWYILPENHPCRTKVHWTFESTDELEGVLKEVKSEFLEDTFEKTFTNREGLEHVIKSFHAEFC